MGEPADGITPGRVIGGRYRLVSPVGRGGMAQVWRADDLRLEREVAVKVVDTGMDGAQERFEREARTEAALAHPNIVALHDAGHDGDVEYLVLELVRGETLADVIARGPLPTAETLSIARQVCDALSAAHAAGIVHRDIKPANILVGDDGRVKVCDFGIACQDSDPAQLGGATAVGTAQYMAPEQASGEAVTARTDLYALGCVIYAMATGHPPFAGNTPTHLAWQHVYGATVRLGARRPDVPSYLDELVTALLAKDPRQRPASASEVRRLLSAAGPVDRSPATTSRRAHAPHVDSEPTVSLMLAGALGPLLPGRRRLAAAGLLTFVTLAAMVFALSALSARDMPVPRLAQPPAGDCQATAASGPPASGECQANGQGTATPGDQTPPPPTDAPPQLQRVGNAATALDALRGTLREQADAGNLEGRQLRDLGDKLDSVEQNLDRGEELKAAQKLAEFRKRLIDLRRDDRVGAVAFDALQSPLAELASHLPTVGDEDDDD